MIWAFIATWAEVCPYSLSKCNQSNTFQAILASDNLNKTFAIFKYKQLSWTSFDDSLNAVVGYSAGDRNTFYEIEGSRTVNIKNSLNALNNVTVIELTWPKTKIYLPN